MNDEIWRLLNDCIDKTDNLDLADAIQNIIDDCQSRDSLDQACKYHRL